MISTTERFIILKIRLFIEKFKTNFQNNTDTQVLLELISHIGINEL